jgi:hypothetical protein
MPWQWPGQRCASRLVRRLVAGEAFKLSALAQELDEELAFDNAHQGDPRHGGSHDQRLRQPTAWVSPAPGHDVKAPRSRRSMLSAPVLRAAGPEPPDPARIDIVERLAGSATTDFGPPGAHRERRARSAHRGGGDAPGPHPQGGLGPLRPRRRRATGRRAQGAPRWWLRPRPDRRAPSSLTID